MSLRFRVLSFALAAGLLSAAPALAAETLSLDQALQMGLAQDPNLKRQALDVEKARLYLNDANAERFTYSADVAVGDRYGVSGLFSNQNLIAGNIPVANGALWARMPLFNGGRLNEQIRGSESLVSGSLARLEKTRQDLVWNITEAYWKAKRSEQRERIRAEAVTAARQARDVAQASVTIGRGAAGDLDRAEVSLLNEESEWIKAQDERDSARDQLASLLQKDLAGVTLLDAPSLPQATGTASLDEALKTALACRPELLLARADLSRQQAGLLTSRADLFPQVDLISAYQHGNNPFIATSQSRDVLSNIVGTFDVRLNLSYHLFDHGYIGRNIARAEKDVESAKEAVESAERMVELEVRQAWRRLEMAKKRLSIAERSEKLALKNQSWTEGRYKAGYVLMVDLDSARLNALSSRNQRLDAQIDHQLASAALQRALGKLESPAPTN